MIPVRDDDARIAWLMSKYPTYFDLLSSRFENFVGFEEVELNENWKTS